MAWFFCRRGILRVLFCSVICSLYYLGSVHPKPLPQDGGTVTQTGEPSHFQVDDKAAEIEVNANPAGVKVNAKPASLQVVAKPGTPAVPIFHPSIHLAQHYAPPPVIHRQPAVFYHGCSHFPFCRHWFYNGIKRGKLPRPGNDQKTTRAHKSDIPRANKHKSDVQSRKRQFIFAVPQLSQPSSLGALTNFNTFGSYRYGSLPQLARVNSPSGAYILQSNPQVSSYASPSQLAFQQQAQQIASTKGLFPTIADIPENSENLRGYEKLYRELSSLTPMYNAILKRKTMNDFQGLGYNSPFDINSGGTFSNERSNLASVPSILGIPQYSNPAGYGKLYLPSQLFQLYAPQSSLMQPIGLLGSSVAEQPFSPYAALSPMLPRLQLVSRSKVPGALAKKTKKHKGHMKEKRKAKRQTFVEPIFREEPDNVDDLMEDGISQDYKRQFILAPALQTSTQQFQPLQTPISQETLQPQVRQLKLQQLLQQPMVMQTVARVQPVGMPQLGMPASAQLGNLLPLESAALRYLQPSMASPMRTLAASVTGRSLPFMSPSLFPSNANPLVSSGLSQPRNVLGSIENISPETPFQDRSRFRQPSRYGFQSYTRRSFLRPQYQRRLEDVHDGNLDGIEPEIIGKEEVTTPGSYTTESVPNSEGDTLINSSVGFGPITVEAKTAEGARAAQSTAEDKRHSIAKMPLLRNRNQSTKRP